MQVPTLEEFKKLEQAVQSLTATVQQLQASQTDWLREEEAQRLTGLSQSTLARERKRPGTLLVVTESPLRYLRRSVDAFNVERLVRKNRYAKAA